MKKATFFALLLLTTSLHAQSLPINFESAVTTADFENFDGGTATVIPNPQAGGINTSATVAQIVRNGGQVWAGSKLALDNNLDFTTHTILSMKVFTTAPVGTTVKFKLEGAGATERDVQTTVTNAWETLTWDFTGAAPNFNQLVFMFDFGNTGNGSPASTFLFDDIEQLYGGIQIDLPVDFEGSTVNYSTTDFGGNVSSLALDPVDTGNTVIRVIKTNQAATWAGTTIGTPAGFATNIPLTLTDSKMTVRIWSPDAGTPIRLKVEDSEDPTHTCETQTNTTVAAGWETLEFDFLNQAPGTELLSVGLSMGWTYNMASIFFNFGTEGAAAGEKTYYFDDVKFGDLASGINNIPEIQGLSAYPNPTNHQWTLTSDLADMTAIDIYNLQGKLLRTLTPHARLATVETSGLTVGTYVARITTNKGMGRVLLVKQ